MALHGDMILRTVMEHNRDRLSSGQHYGTARDNSLWSGSMAPKWVNSPWNGNRIQQGDSPQCSNKKQQREKMILQVLWHKGRRSSGQHGSTARVYSLWSYNKAEHGETILQVLWHNEGRRSSG